MPKENINDITQDRWRTEVSWRPESRFCRACATAWTAPVDVCDCSGYRPGDVVVTSGHVQLATVNLDSPFVFPANPAAPDEEPAEPFDGWRVTFDQAAIERTIDALMKAGAQAFLEWKRDWSTGGSSAERPQMTTITFAGGPWNGEPSVVERLLAPVFSPGDEVGKNYWLDTKSDPPVYNWVDPV